MRRSLVLLAAMACFAACTCQGRSSPSTTATDAGMASSQSPPSTGAQPVPPEPPVPERAMQLHMEGRNHGRVGQFEEALRSFQQARELAPTWPLPLYDVGLTYLYMNDDARALEAYQQLDALAPQGVSESKRMLDSLLREKDGRVPQGTLREFLEIRRLKELPEIQRRLEALTQKAPAFVPAWQELAMFSSDKPEEAERLIAQALSLGPDVDSRSRLLVYKATLMWRRGESAAARKQLQAILDDPTTPPSVAVEARELLSLPPNVTP